MSNYIQIPVVSVVSVLLLVAFCSIHFDPQLYLELDRVQVKSWQAPAIQPQALPIQIPARRVEHWACPFVQEPDATTSPEETCHGHHASTFKKTAP